MYAVCNVNTITRGIYNYKSMILFSRQQKGHERLLSEDIIMEEDEEEFVEIMAPESPPPADVEMREASASPPRVLVSTLERSGEQHPMVSRILMATAEGVVRGRGWAEVVKA